MNCKNRDQANIAVYDKIYSERKELLNYPDEILVSYIFNTLKNDAHVKRVMIVGFGAGRHVTLFANMGYDVSGVEPSLHAVQEARKRMEQSKHDVDLRIGTCGQLPFLSDSFDVVLCWGVINNIVDTDEVERSMKEMKRVLRVGGRLLISLMAPEDMKFHGAKRVKADDNVYRILYGQHEYYTRFWNREQGLLFVESYGFIIEKIGYVLRCVNFDEGCPVAYYTISAVNSGTKD